jgi:predicted AlkP superfamily phosphohydrolase/phosphomutase
MHELSGDYRVLLVGLDGVTWRLLKPWADAGHLPHLSRLMAGGAWGPLASTVIPQTPPAWTSMVTGVHPGKHGILGFVKRRPGTYEKEYPTSRDRGRDAVWDILGRAGRRSIIVDLPLSYPPDRLHGIMVTGLGTPGPASNFVWPADLKDTILGAFGPWEFDVYYAGDVRAFIDDAIRVTEHRLAVARYLMREHPWEFFMLVLTTPDRLQHVVWKYVDPQHPLYVPEAATRYWPAIADFYRRLDQAVGELRSLAGERTVLIVASDHGFGPVHTRASISRWLAAEGLLTLGGRRQELLPSRNDLGDHVRGGGRVEKRDDDQWVLTVEQPVDFAGIVMEIPGLQPTSNYEVRAFVAESTPGAVLEFKDLSRPVELIIGGGPLDAGPSEVAAVFQPQADPVRLMLAMTTYGGNPCGHFVVNSVMLSELEDWTKTSAYSLEVGEAGESRRIRINLRGREPHGIVVPGVEYDRLRAAIAAGLRGLRDTATGRPLVARVLHDEDAFSGSGRRDEADLLVLFADGVGGTSTRGESDYAGAVSYPATEGFSGRHEAEGVLLVSGPPVAGGAAIKADIVDVCPTVLHVLGAPIPDDLDGRVLTEVFTPAYEAARPVRAASTSGKPAAPSASEAAGYTEQERQQVEERLRRLGYVE